MPRITTTITDKQSGKKEEAKVKTTTKQAKVKFVLLNKAEMPVATLIDKDMAEKWVADHKLGAVKFVEETISAIAKGELA